MSRLIFVNRFFFPDQSATSQILSDLAFHLAETGRDVHVITSRMRYNDPAAILAKNENIRGVQVHRIVSTRFGRTTLLGRGADYLSFYVTLRSALLKLARTGDTIVAKTDPPLLSIPAMNAARRRGANLVNWLQDLYPEVAINLQVPYFGGPLGAVLRSLRDRSLNFAAMNITVGEKMAVKIRELGVSPERVRTIANWSNDEEIVPILPSRNPLRDEWDLENKFVIGYSGNLGRAHQFETLLSAAELLRGNSHIVFLFIGGGHAFNELSDRVKERNLDQIFRFKPYQDRSQLKYSLGVPDVHLLSLRPELEGLIVPSKFYGIAAAGRPIIAALSKDGELVAPIERYRCGVVVPYDQPAQLADVLLKLSQDSSQCAAMGIRARQMLEAEFTKKNAFERWQETLQHF